MDFVCVGKIVKPQGIKGEVKILPLIDIPAIFNGKYPLYIEKIEAKTLSRSYRLGAGYVHFAEIPDRTVAEKYRGKKVYITREDFEKISGDNFLIDDLVGNMIFDEKENMVGQIMGVTDYGFDDIIVVKSDGRLYEVPFKKAIFSVEKLDGDLKISCVRAEFDGAKVEA